MQDGWSSYSDRTEYTGFGEGADEVSTTAPSPTLKKKNNPLEPMSADNLSVALSVVYSDAIGKH